MTARILFTALLLSSAGFGSIYYVSTDGTTPEGVTNAFTSLVSAYTAAASDTIEHVVVVLPGLLTERGSLLLSNPLVSVRGYGPGASALGADLAVVVQDESHIADIEIYGAVTNDAARLFVSNVRLDCTPTCPTNIVGTMILTNGTIRVRNLAPAVEPTDAVPLGQLNAMTSSLDAASITTGTLAETRISSEIIRTTQLDAATGSLMRACLTNFVAKNGDRMSGVLDMGGNIITNLAEPATADAAATRAYVDHATNQLATQEYIEAQIAAERTYDACLGKTAPDLYSALTNGAKTIFVPAGTFTSDFASTFNVSGRLVVKGHGKGVSKLLLNLDNNLYFNMMDNFDAVIFEDLDLILTNRASADAWFLFYNDHVPSPSAFYAFRNCRIGMWANSTVSDVNMFRLDQGGVHIVDIANSDIDIHSSGSTYLLCTEYDHQRTARVVFRDVRINIQSGIQSANRLASVLNIKGRPLEADVVMENVVCSINGSINADTAAIYIGKQGNPTLLRRLVLDNIWINTPNRCIQVSTDIDMLHISGSRFIGSKGLYLCETTGGQMLSNIVVSASTFDCGTCLDFGSRTLTSIDPIMVTGCKFRGTPTNTADNVRMVWADNEVDGSLSTYADQRYLLTTGGRMSGSIDMAGNNISNIGTLTVANILATSQIVQNVTVTNFTLSTSNLALQGVLDMGGNVISNVGSPTEGHMVATKKYVDDITNAIGQGVESVAAVAPLSIAGGSAATVSLGMICEQDISNSAITSTKILNGAITAGKLASMGAASGQILTWTGTAWTPAYVQNSTESLLLSNTCASKVRPASAAVDKGSIWSNVEGCLNANDASEARAFDDGNCSSALCITGFTFNIPGDAVIRGIEIRAISRAEAGYEYVIYPMIITNNLSAVENWDHYLYYSGGTCTNNDIAGGSEDIWNIPATPQLINSPEFGIALTMWAAGDNVCIDYVEMTVYYTYVGTNFVNRGGDTMTGPLILSGDPTESLQAASKAYVDSITNGLGSGTVTAVTATSPLASSGGTTPNISLEELQDADVADNITISAEGNIDAAAITSGTINEGRLPDSVTLDAELNYALTNFAQTVVGKSGDTMTGALTVPSLLVSGTNDWYVGTDIDEPTHIVMMSEGGEIRSVSDLVLHAQNNNKILFKSPVKFEAGIDEAGRAGRTNNVTTSDSGLQIAVPGCTENSVVLITPTTNSCPDKFWVETASGGFTVKSTTSETWSFNYLVR